jgi:hypothetical protein
LKFDEKPSFGLFNVAPFQGSGSLSQAGGMVIDVED